MKYFSPFQDVNKKKVVELMVVLDDCL